MAERGHETHLLAGEWDKNFLDERIKAHAVEMSGKSDLAKLKTFVEHCPIELAKVAPEAVGSFGVVSPQGVCWVQSVHAAWLKISAERRDWKGRLKQKLNPFHPYILNLEREVFGGRRYDKLIALTPDVKNDLMHFYNVPESDIAVIPNGFAPREFNLESRALKREEMRQKLGFKPEHKVVIFVANELERKGFGPLLHALVSMNRKDLQLLAVGRLDASAYAGTIEKLGWTGRVHFTGPTSNVADYYAAADVFALPTQYEAWGLVIIEAMACGLPVLTSALAGAAVAVKDGSTGNLLQNPDDVSEIAAKLTPILEGKHASDSQIALSVAHYAWDKVLLDYEKLLAQHARS